MTNLNKHARRYRIHVALVLANVTFAAVFVAVALSGFHQPTPHSLPVGIVAPPREAGQIGDALDAHARNRFELKPFSSVAGARTALETRGLDAVLVSSRDGLHLLTAGAGGTATAQAITAAFTAVAAHADKPLITTDLVPPTNKDSQGLSSFFLILCVLFPSLATGIGAGHVLRRTGVLERLAVLVALAAIVGLTAAAIGDGISGLGHYWSIAGIVALFSLAISAPAAALAQLTPHLAAIAVLAFLVFGIPSSGGPAGLSGFGPELLRSLTSGLPLGVAVAAVRNTVYFRAAATTGHLWVLAAYALGGIAALSLACAAAGRGGRGADAVNRRAAAASV
jgi:hypothetical protein